MNKLRFSLILLLFIALCTNLFAQSSAYPFQVQKSGQGKQAIIFIPGFASSGAVWNETKARFEKNFECHVLTMAGFAGTKPQADNSFTYWETAIADYIKANNLQKPVIVGHSMGGGLAMAIAADFPALVGRIVVVDALPCLSALMNPAFKTKENNDCSATVKQITGMTNEQFYRMQKQTMPGLVADTNMFDTLIRWSTSTDRKTFAEVYCGFSNTDLREKIETVTCPALILLEAYFVTMKPAIEDQYKNLKQANLQYSDKALHFIMYDDKEWYFTQLNNFIKTR